MNSADVPRIGIKSHLRTEIFPGEGACVISPRRTMVLRGAAAERLLPLLDGTRTLAELVGEVNSELPAARVGQLLGRLAEAKMIRYRSGAPPEGYAATEAYWDLAGLDGPRVSAELGDGEMAVISVGETDASHVVDLCRASGLAASQTGARPADFSLVLCDDYLDPAIAEINTRHLAEGRSWLLAKTTGADLWVGPTFRPGSGPCWSCLAERLRLHRRRPLPVVQGAPRAPVRPPEASLSVSRALGLNLAVLEAAKWLAGIRHKGQDAIWTLDTITMNGQPHPVSRRPQCRSCGEPELESARAWRPVVTVPRPKQAHAGGHRTLSAERVLDRYGHLADSVTGIVGELRRDRRVLAPFHGYLSGHNLAIANSSIASVMAGLQMQSGGKGITDLDAKAGALCEALERYCGSRSGNEATVSGSYRQLGAVAIHPNDCQLFHERQFSDRARWNSSCATFQRIPEPFDKRKVIEWTPLWSLTERRHRLLPTDMLYYQGDRAGRAGIWADSNGNAAGSSIEEGILQGFLELVERDAVALWWYNRTRHPEVDLESFDDDWLARLRTEYMRIGREIWVVDVTSDLAIPVMAAISRKIGQVPEEIVLGFGAHFDPRLALRQALGEVNQLLAAATGGDAGGTGSETAGSGTTDRHLRDWLKRATIANQPYLRPTPDAATHRAEDYTYCPRADLQHDIDHICALARHHRLNILVLDQTRPDVKLPVVKVVVPGLRHFWARFAPGRLYDVPAKLGRVAESTPYEKLNPIPLFF